MEERIYNSIEEAQAALDAGEQVHIAVQPYAFDPALLQLALDLQAKARLEEFKRLEQGQVVCEACGQLFQVSEGYYEPGKYAYCVGCCHW